MDRYLKFLLVLAIVLTIPSTLFAFAFVGSVRNLSYYDTTPEFNTDPEFAYVETAVDNYGVDAPGFSYVSQIEFTEGCIGWLETETWGHTLSGDYMNVPDDFTVSSATLEISGWRYYGFGVDIVQVGGTCMWTEYGGWEWAGETNNIIDMTDIDSELWNSSQLNVSMTPIFDYGVNLNSSVLSIDYNTTNDDPSDAIPEPTTLLLVGLGLAGLGVRARRK
ncbi:MAG: PEP-CTERM sorting domain-containing protein [candidate division Zixibacteria bacterium]|nr:PEP-CTERM sorting domain-containing protein [candidate division Zixibacteria bacterium]